MAAGLYTDLVDIAPYEEGQSSKCQYLSCIENCIIQKVLIDLQNTISDELKLFQVSVLHHHQPIAILLYCTKMAKILNEVGQALTARRMALLARTPKLCRYSHAQEF